MNLKAIDAANAYAGALKNRALASDSAPGKGSFSDVLKAALTETEKSVNASTNAGIEALNGKADLVDVVTSVQNAEMVLETVVAVRDKVIAAYQDIIKMPI